MANVVRANIAHHNRNPMELNRDLPVEMPRIDPDPLPALLDMLHRRIELLPRPFTGRIPDIWHDFSNLVSFVNAKLS